MQMEDKICSPEKYIHVTWMKKEKKKKEKRKKYMTKYFLLDTNLFWLNKNIFWYNLVWQHFSNHRKTSDFK